MSVAALAVAFLLLSAAAGWLLARRMPAPAAAGTRSWPNQHLRWPALRLRSRTAWSGLHEREDGYGPGQVAVVNCRSRGEQNRLRFHSTLRGSCRDLQLIHGGERACAWACLGEGDCARACGEGAISMREGLPVVEAARCTGCGDCVSACPRQVLSLIPVEAQVYHACNSNLDPARRAALCEAGCGDHGRCLQSRFLPDAAVGSREGRRVLDYSRSDNLLPLLSLCPTGSFVDRVAHRPWFTVNEHCTGCGDCLPLCPAPDCILPHGEEAATPVGRTGVRIAAEACTGCGLCLPACRPQAIRVVGALGYGFGAGKVSPARVP